MKKGCESKCVCDDGLYRSKETGECLPIEDACSQHCNKGTDDKIKIITKDDLYKLYNIMNT